MKIKTIITTVTSTTVLLAGLSMTAYAGNASDSYDSDTDHDHTGEVAKSGKKMSMPMKGNMQEKMTAIQAEMQTIINTEDKAKRQALFAAHKEKMKSMMRMMQNMHGDCGNKHEMNGKAGINHQGESD